MKTHYTRLTRTCVVCGKQFEGTNRAKYCSKAHNVAASRTRTNTPSVWQRVKQLETQNAQLRTQLDQLRPQASTQTKPLKEPRLTKAKKVVDVTKWLDSIAKKE